MQKKRMTAAIVTVILVLSSLTASAEWLSAGYDTTDLDNITKVYNEVIDGNYTSRFKEDKLPESAIVWKAEGYELAYPHAGYDRLYLEGNRQEITRYNNLFPQWETRFVDQFWEIGGNHRIYQRQQTKVPGYGWVFDYSDNEAIDAALCVPTNREATVSYSFKPYGVGPFDMNGNYVSEEVEAMYNRFIGEDAVDEVCGRFAYDSNKNITSGLFTPESLSAINTETGYHYVSDEVIAGLFGSIVSIFVSGPSYPGSVTKVAATEYLKHPNWEGWHADTVKWGGANVSWTKPTFEMKAPYKMYQFLVVNGLVFDGRNDLPRIWRYTGGKATPNVEWKYAFPEADLPQIVMAGGISPFDIIEFKYVNGKLAIDEVTGEPIYRVTDEYANVYVKTTDKEIQYWIKDDVTNAEMQMFSVPRTSTTGSYGGYVGGATFIAN